MKKTATRSVLVATTTGSFITTFMVSSLTIALPSIGATFALDAVTLGWIASSYLLSATVFLLPWGRMADLYGRKHIFLYGMVLFALASALSAVAPSPALLILFRALHGIAASMVFATAVALLISAVPPPGRGRVLGINVAATYIGLSIGPFVGGLLTRFWGWRSVFWVTALLALLNSAFVLWKIPGESSERIDEPFDIPGTLLYLAGCSAAMFGLSLLPGIRAAALLAGGLLGLFLFGLWERGRTHPLLDVTLLTHNAAFAFSNLAALVNYSATFSVSFLLSLYLQYVRGMQPHEAGAVLVAQPVVQALFSPFAGALSDRLEPRTLASAGMGLTTLGVLMLAFVDAGTPLPYLLASLVILGSGFALFSSPNTNAVMRAVAPRQYGVASGTLSTMRMTGQMVSMGIALSAFALTLGTARITPEHFPAFLKAVRSAFLISAFLCCGGIFASLARGTVHPEKTTQ